MKEIEDILMEYFEELSDALDRCRLFWRGIR